MGIGKLVYRFREKYKHGLRAAWYRDRVRPRILYTNPVRNTTDTRCEIHVLTCGHDWLNLIWTLKSFYKYSKRNYGLCIHDDGTVGKAGREALIHHFPNSRVISRHQSDDWARSLQAGFPRLTEFRTLHSLSLKITDFHGFLEAEKMLVFDSDLLFFAEPTTLIRNVEDPAYNKNCFNEDIDNAFSIEPEIAKEKMQIEILPRFKLRTGSGAR